AALLFCAVPRRGRAEAAVPASPRDRHRDDRGDNVRSISRQRQDRSAEVRASEVASTNCHGTEREEQPMTRAATVIVSVALLPASLFAQPVRDASLLVTVLDQTGGVLPGATVTVAGAEPSNKTAVIA